MLLTAAVSAGLAWPALAGLAKWLAWGRLTPRSRPPVDISVDISASSAEYGLIRQWMTVVDCAAGDLERVRGWGGCGIAVRVVLAALGQAAIVSGSSVIEFGTGIWPCTRLWHFRRPCSPQGGAPACPAGVPLLLHTCRQRVHGPRRCVSQSPCFTWLT